jgi:hypothetical protein
MEWGQSSALPKTDPENSIDTMDLPAEWIKKTIDFGLVFVILKYKTEIFCHGCNCN